MCNLSQGIEDNGVNKAKLDIAKKMIKRGDSINDIVELTELAIDVVERLKINVLRATI